MQGTIAERTQRNSSTKKTIHDPLNMSSPRKRGSSTLLILYKLDSRFRGNDGLNLNTLRSLRLCGEFVALAADTMFYERFRR
jgi:hypothetical protein